MVNRLANTTSPYLLQHQGNPVDWHPWGDEALQLARTSGKPILLSVGYAACHWCHVMAHESFEDPATAAIMNEHYVNIKVDREERPDLDAIYQAALALMGQPGGWPLTMFLTPQGEPFAGGTYFPPTERYGRPGFPRVLVEIARIYRDEGQRVEASRSAILDRLKTVLNPAMSGTLTVGAIDALAARTVRHIDPFHGGLGEATKFPNVPVMEMLWRAYLRTGEEPYRRAVVNTLTHICQGGIYDHLAGGFCRYSVDERWLVPHFEKMLYDNAQLVSLLTLVWQKTRIPLFAARVEETIDWLLKEMSVGGAFASSLDADSEGHEGRFYVWGLEEILTCLGVGAGAHFAGVYGVTEDGNFEGSNVLNRLADPDWWQAEEEARLKVTRETLLARRGQRIRPDRDDKVLADWNGLMIAALARAGLAFARPDWLKAAEDAFAAIRAGLVEDSDPPRLHHSMRAGRRGSEGMAEDYAETVAAALALAEATGRPDYLRIAAGLTKTAETLFQAEGGGFYQSAAGARDVIVRSRTIFDGAVPCANAVLLANYVRLHFLAGYEGALDKAAELIALFAGVAQENPIGTASFLNGADLYFSPLAVVVSQGKTSAVEEERALVAAVETLADPNRILSRLATGQDLPPAHPGHGKGPQGGRTTVYVCRGQTCSLPITEAAALAALVGG